MFIHNVKYRDVVILSNAKNLVGSHAKSLREILNEVKDGTRVLGSKLLYYLQK